MRRYHAALTRIALLIGDAVTGGSAPYEILDGTAVAVRNVKRRGRSWLAGAAALGKSNRLGWYYGFRIITTVAPDGIITGFGAGPGNAEERHLAEVLFAARADAHPRLASVGHWQSTDVLADSGFWGLWWCAHWYAEYGLTVHCPPQADTRYRWPRSLRRWLAHYRQIIESVHRVLLGPLRLEQERPHTLDGFLARLAAKVALHNFCVWLNHLLGRPPLAVADLIDW